MNIEQIREVLAYKGNKVKVLDNEGKEQSVNLSEVLMQ